MTASKKRAHGGSGDGRSQTFPFASRVLATDEGPLAYFDEGDGEAVVFVHGLVGDFTHFEHVAPAFAHAYRIAGLDLPGCGISYKSIERHSIASYARALLDWMSSIGIERATLVGHSAGGLVAAKAALFEPRRAERLVLVNSAGLRHYGVAARLFGRALMRPWLLEATLERLAMPMLDHVFVARNPYTEKFVEDSLNRPAYPTLREMAKVFHDLAPDLVSAEILDSAARFTMPLLVLWGDGDRLIAADSIRALAARFPDARTRILAGCGHMPIIERPEEVVAEIGAFLGAPPQKAAS